MSQSIRIDCLSIGDTVKSIFIVKLGNRVQGSKKTVLLCTVRWVCTRCKRFTCFSSIRKRACSLTINNVGSNSKDGCGWLRITVSMNVFQLLKECRQKSCCDLVCSVIIITITWEVTLNLEICCNAVFIADSFNFCIFDSGQGVYYMRESCDTCCERTLNLCIDQSHLCSFIVVFIMHVVDHVQCSDIQMSQPVHHLVIFCDYFIIVKIFRSDRLIAWSYLLFCLLINTAVDRVKKAFCKVCTSTEELHLFTCLCSRYTAADAVVIAPYRTHNIIILILNRTCCNRNICSIFLEVLRQS